MEKMYDIASGQILNLGNAYTYTVTAADKAAYSAFILTTGASVTVSDGVASVGLTLAANEECPLNNATTTIVGTVDNVIVFLY